ncbi:MAG: DUF5103 domain-containing protein [Bacteroidales bacterium]|nr:DUF5103 domain-containing protein [Bacteroidales bacterium]
MKRLAAIILVLLTLGTAEAQRVVDSAWRSDVKTVQLYRGGESREVQAELLTPVLTLGERARLTLEFDILGAEALHTSWNIAHCDRNWQRDDLEPQEFMTGFEGGSVDDYDFSFTTLTDYVHYRAVVPDQYAEFTHSGNYALTVTDDATGEVLLTRRFCVSEAAAKVGMEIGKPYDGMEIDRRQEVDVTVKSSGTVWIDLRPEYTFVRVQQNGRHDNARWLEFSGYDGDQLAYRSRKANVFDGGNTFRYFDCSNLRSPMYNVMRIEELGGEQFAILRPDEDRSKKHYLSEKSLNGGMQVNIWDRNNPRVEADYVWVNFCLPMEQPMMDGNVYVVGALTDWRLDSLSMMDYSASRRAYTKRLLLKQGYYAYQLLVARRQAPAYDSKTRQLEGDHRETQNHYTVYVYHRSPADRADRLIAATRRHGGQ